MSFDNVGGTIPVLDNPQSLYLSGPEFQAEHGPSLVGALALLSAASTESDSVLLPGVDTPGLDDGGEPFFTLYEPDMPSDDAGGYIELYEPTIYVPDGFDADDLYAVEFILNQSTGELTINLLFSTDPLDNQMSGSIALGSDLVGADGLSIGLGFGDVPLEQAGQANGSKCTVTITRTTTQNSGTSTVSFMGGLVNYSTTSGGSSTTTTRTVSIEGIIRNGRCVVSTR